MLIGRHNPFALTVLHVCVCVPQKRKQHCTLLGDNCRHRNVKYFIHICTTIALIVKWVIDNGLNWIRSGGWATSITGKTQTDLKLITKHSVLGTHYSHSVISRHKY